MDVLIVGSIAYDSLESPAGKSENELGGSASYGGFSAAFHSKMLGLSDIALVGVVGDDFSKNDLSLYDAAGLNIEGIEILEGETFRWKGAYHGDMAVAQTLETHLNVFENFVPKVPKFALEPNVLFCANLHPAIQLSVLNQTTARRLTVLDSMNLWIDIARDELITAMKRVDLVILNDGEIRMLAGEQNLILAGKIVQEMAGNPILVIKRGEHGVTALHREGIISIPAYPVIDLIDPTGCGDSFAGAMTAHLAKGDGEISHTELMESLVHATVTASFTLESFGTDALRAISPGDYQSRLIAYRALSNTRLSQE
tara:strand:+ start:1723 stop:2661 length:939 start_codon:yes stop_codon:yes gene_type:complete